MTPPVLKFLIDVGVGRKVEEYLTKQGHDVATIRDIDPRMSDSDIIRLSALQSRVIVTMDKDFGELVYHSSLEHSGVLLLRLEDATGAQKVRVVADIMKGYSTHLPNSFCVYQSNKFRVRKSTH